MTSVDKQRVACPLFAKPDTNQEYKIKGYVILDGIGRIVTGTRGGSYLTVDASNENYGEGWELRWNVADWADVDTISQFQGIFLAVQNSENNASAGIRGMEVQVRDNDVGIGSMQAIHANAYIKGSSASKTIGVAIGVQAQLEFASNVGTRTVGTIACALQCIVYTAGTITGLTNIHGIDIKFGDQDGGSTTVGSGIQMSSDTGTSGTRTLTAGISITIACTTAISIVANCGNGIVFNGTYTDDVIDFTNVTINHTGSGGPCLIRAGAYESGLTNADEDQSGLIRLYGTTTADGTSYDRGVFVCLTTTGTKGIFPIAGLAEVRAQSGNGPVSVMACQFICDLHTIDAKLANTTGVGGMFAGWFKITAIDGSTCGATSKKAAIWLDNQMYGNNAAPGEEYTIYATTGGLKPDAFIGFETSSSGWSNLLSFDETAYDQDPISSLGAKNEVNSDASIKIDLNGTTYYIPIFVVANME